MRNVSANVEPIYCPNNYQFYNGSCYGIHNETLYFTEAETECNKLPNGHLASYNSQHERNFLVAFARYVKGIHCKSAMDFVLKQ